MSNFYRDPGFILETIETWLDGQLSSAGDKGGIVGLSGGIDSAVVAAILKRIRGNRMLAVIMPCHSQPTDQEHAEMVAARLDLPTTVVNLTAVYDAFLSSLPSSGATEDPLARANLKPRLRMNALYFLAQERNLLVCGTGNKVELTAGYFTKYGDSGVDLLPLGDLLKGEVRQLAALLKIPKPIIEKAPSAGLWQGQTDESEMGVSYDELDRYLATGEGSEKAGQFLEKARVRSEHKRNVPPLCRIGETKQA